MSEAFHPPANADAGADWWQLCVEQLARELPEQQFNNWIKPLVGQLAPDLSKLSIQVENRFKLDWIRAQYSARITALLAQAAGQPVRLELVLAPRESPAKPSSIHHGLKNLGLAEPAGLGQVEEAPGAPFKSRLNSALTFDSLIEGSANRMGRAAAMHVASNIGQLYNPLFIYGGVGLGKTHLVHAIGNKLLADNPNAKVLYIHAEQFVSDVVKA